MGKIVRKSPGYIKKELLKDSEEPTRYLTIDCWADCESLNQFRQDFHLEFDALDKMCEGYTKSERHIGDFDIL